MKLYLRYDELRIELSRIFNLMRVSALSQWKLKLDKIQKNYNRARFDWIQTSSIFLIRKKDKFAV